MAPRTAAQNPSTRTAPETFTREFFVQCGRRGGGRPKLPPQLKTERAIQRLERRLAELRATLPCRKHLSGRKAAR